MPGTLLEICPISFAARFATHCRGQVDERNPQTCVVLTTGLELLERGEGLEPADDQQTLDLVLGESRGDALEVLAGLFAVRAELRSAARRPLIDTQPAELDNVVLQQAGDRVVDGERRVTAREAEANGRTRRRIHPTCRCAETVDSAVSHEGARTA